MENKRNERYMGTVTFYNTEKGFGFIRAFDGKDYFVHKTQIMNDDELIKNSIVEFEVYVNKKDPSKVNASKVLVCEVPEKSKDRKY